MSNQVFSGIALPLDIVISTNKNIMKRHSNVIEDTHIDFPESYVNKSKHYMLIVLTKKEEEMKSYLLY